MKEKILNILRDLRSYALKKGYEVTIFYHEEDSYLMRFANSAISLNTNEHLIRLEITAYVGNRRASYELITNLDKVDEMKQGIDVAAEMAQHAQPLNYQPTIPALTESFADESSFDPALAQISNEERLAFFNHAVAGLETEDIKLSGVFTNGANTIAQITTRSAHTQYFKTSDAQVTAVLAHSKLKWEVQSEQSAQQKSDLDPDLAHAELAFLLAKYQQSNSLQLPLGCERRSWISVPHQRGPLMPSESWIRTRDREWMARPGMNCSCSRSWLPPRCLPWCPVTPPA